jgi:hypothetical protein
MQTTTPTRRAVLAGTASACLVAALPMPDDRAVLNERALRAFRRLTLQQQEDALRRLEAMFPNA